MLRDMEESGKIPFILKKSFEVAYAIFRISGNLKDTGFAGTLRQEATHLMGCAANGDYIEAIRSTVAIEYFVRLAVEVNFISFLNTELLLRETGNLKEVFNSAIAGSDNPAMEETDLSDIFSSPFPAGEQNLFQEHPGDSSNHKEEKENNPAKSGIRQTAILEKIRQSGNCRLKDIQEVFPDISERTLRYDLQFLAEHDLIERVGVGGPAVFYRLRQTTDARIPPAG
jgi:hypothetical protein